MEVTYLGHSAYFVFTRGKKLLFDPFISANPIANATALGDYAPDKIEPDYILLSHGHQDHMADLESIAKRTDAQVITNA